MKKLKIFASVICMVFASLAASAQMKMYSTNAAALIPTIDTITNTGVKTMTVKNPYPTSQRPAVVTVSAVVTKISGTGAGTVTLQGSIDGINYATVASTALIGGQTATFTLGDVAVQTYIFELIGTPFLYYRITGTGSGTEVVSIQGRVF